ncbi:hypothetical protein HMPREF0083_05582, partial [Aneurinibacillus aneurinilyticus ATCC 12856]
KVCRFIKPDVYRRTFSSQKVRFFHLMEIHVYDRKNRKYYRRIAGK